MSGICDSFSGSITGKVLTFNPDAIPESDMLYIRMTRGARRIAGELRKAFGWFRRVVIDVDGELHEFRADSFIRLLEDYEVAQDASRYAELFGTPERAARTIVDISERVNLDRIGGDYDALLGFDGIGCEFDALLEWLRGGGE